MGAAELKSITMDDSVRSGIIQLIEKATDESNHTERNSGQLLSLLGRGAAYVQVAHDALQIRLRANHAQRRLLALQLMDAVFRKVKAFRRLLCHDFQCFLELTVGYRREKPLPPPAEAAEALRQLALELIERWRDEHGKECPQVVSGCRYLRDGLGMKLPELRARAARRHEQQAARRQRTQQLLLERYKQLPLELLKIRQEAYRLLTQLRECEDLLLSRGPEEAGAAAAAASDKGLPAAGQGLALSRSDAGTGEPVLQPCEAPCTADCQGPVCPSQPWPKVGGSEGQPSLHLPCSKSETLDLDPAADPGPEDLEWEDVDLQSWQEDDVAGGGLADYAALGAGGATAAPSHLDEGATQGVLDNMSDIAKRLASRSVAQLQAWLRLLVQLDLGSGSQEAAARLERDRLLREVIALRNSIQEGLAQAQARGAHVPAAALQTSTQVAPKAVSVAVTLTASGAQQEASDDEEGSQGSGLGVCGGEAEGTDEEDEELLIAGGSGGAAAEGSGLAEEQGSKRLCTGLGHRALGSAGCAWRPRAQPQRRPEAGRFRRPAGGMPSAAAAAAARASYNDKVITATGDEAVARRLEREQQGEVREQGEATGSGRGLKQGKKAVKLSGKALIKKKLGLL